MKKCTVCGVEIPEGRLKVLPNTKTCVNHSQASRYVGNIVSQGDVEAGEAFQEFDIVRSDDGKRALELYRDKLGSYK